MSLSSLLLLAAGGMILGWLRARQRVEPEPGRTPTPRSNEDLAKSRMSKEKPQEKRFGNRQDRDIVDEASWESFPASDPPSW